MTGRSLLAACAAALVMAGTASTIDGAASFDEQTVPFAITFGGETTAYQDAAAFLLPGATLPIEVTRGPSGPYTLDADAGILVQQGPRKWKYTAAARPGLSKISINGPGRDKIELRVFVLVPMKEAKNGTLNGYRIGQYPPPLKGNVMYLPPPGFVEITKDNEDTKLSPHFRLKQFICKQEPLKQFPKYAFLHPRLPLKLEAVLARVNALGFRTDTLHVMSAYRTPVYNAALGDVKYSMHQFGGASDVFIDPEDKGRMVDLNKDGRVDISDSKFLYDEVERMLGEKPYQHFQGGLGYYPATSAHPPFVHVDVRGTRARWKG